MKPKDRDALLKVLQTRFAKHMARHQDMTWTTVQQRLLAAPAALVSLHAMESSGGEPDAVGLDTTTGQVMFCDCAPESPAGRRSLCYDRAALDGRKENKPSGNAQDTARTMGVELLDETQYRALQRLGEFDTKTSSWIATPAAIRDLGGALFCDRRYGQIFTYHNGASSYYAARGFRGLLRV